MAASGSESGLRPSRLQSWPYMIQALFPPAGMPLGPFRKKISRVRFDGVRLNRTHLISESHMHAGAANATGTLLQLHEFTHAHDIVHKNPLAYYYLDP